MDSQQEVEFLRAKLAEAQAEVERLRAIIAAAKQIISPKIPVSAEEDGN